jgi:hypothetical protein
MKLKAIMCQNSSQSNEAKYKISHTSKYSSQFLYRGVEYEPDTVPVWSQFKHRENHLTSMHVNIATHIRIAFNNDN